MKLATVEYNGIPRTCIVKNDSIYDVEGLIPFLFDSNYAMRLNLDSHEKYSFNHLNILSNGNVINILKRVDEALGNALAGIEQSLPNEVMYDPNIITFLPPIPHAPLMFGLAGNCPQTWRRSPEQIPNYPVGYSRPRSSMAGHNQRVVIPRDVTSFRCAAELGVVIGKVARNVSETSAMDYVFGYVCVNDMISNHWKQFARENNPEQEPSFHEFLITSYYGRGTDGFGPVGPWIVTKDEVKDPYNLLMFTKQNEVIRDRSYTDSMVVSIERAISYLSKFMTLLPGSIIHMGAMGLDGITISQNCKLNQDDYVEIEIENVGMLRTYFDDFRVAVES